MEDLKKAIAVDVERVSQISIVPSILETICRITGMGFAVVARVTAESWVACEVLDKIKFGLIPGGELKVDTTICHEIRQSGKEVVIDHVAADDVYISHHTPAMYGFQSYISVPIARQDGNFFGTLCAIDPNPSLLNTPEIIGMFKAYAELISFHLHALERLPSAKVKSLEAATQEKLNEEMAVLIKHEDHTATSPGEQLPQQRVVNKRSRQFANVIQQSANRIKEYTAHLRSQYPNT